MKSAVAVHQGILLDILIKMLFSVFRRRQACCLFEGLVEKFDIIESTLPGNLGRVFISGFQQPAGFPDPQILDVGGNGGAGYFFEYLAEIVFAQKNTGYNIIQVDMGLIILLHITDGLFHKLLVVDCEGWLLSLQLSEKLDDQLNQICTDNGLGPLFTIDIFSVDLCKQVVEFLGIGLDQMMQNIMGIKFPEQRGKQVWRGKRIKFTVIHAAGVEEIRGEQQVIGGEGTFFRIKGEGVGGIVVHDHYIAFFYRVGDSLNGMNGCAVYHIADFYEIVTVRDSVHFQIVG